MNKKQSALVRFGVMASAFVAPLTVYAADGLKNARTFVDTVGSQAGYNIDTTTNSLPNIVGKIIAAALTFLGILLLGYLLYAGFLWMTSGGESEKADQAKTMIRNAIIGLIIIMSSYAISGFVLEKINIATGGT